MTAAPQSTPIVGAKETTASSVVPALRNALAAALVAFGLCFPIISFHAESNINNELILIGRWPLSFGVAASSPCSFCRAAAHPGGIGSTGWARLRLAGRAAPRRAAREGEGVAQPSRARVAFSNGSAVRARFRRAVSVIMLGTLGSAAR